MSSPKKEPISEKQENDGKTPLGICYLEKYGKIRLPDEVLSLLNINKESRDAIVLWKKGEHIILSKREEII